MKNSKEMIDKAEEKLNLSSSPREEGRLTKAIEQQTAKIPSVAFLAVGIASIIASLGLRAAGKKNAANFVGMWTPTVLLLGIYDKIVKVEGSEGRTSDSFFSKFGRGVGASAGRSDRTSSEVSSSSPNYTM